MKSHRLFVPQSMLPALLSGAKTQHRVPLKRQPQPAVTSFGLPALPGDFLWARDNGLSFTVTNKPNGPDDYSDECPYQPGDEVWCGEVWSTSGLKKYHYTGNPDDHGGPNDPCCAYAATASYKCGKPIPPIALARGDHKWKSPATMPRWAARIVRTVKAVRVERVQDISEDDAVAEGIPPSVTAAKIVPSPCGPIAIGMRPNANVFALVSHYTMPGAWDRNDWVWVLDFEEDKR